MIYYVHRLCGFAIASHHNNGWNRIQGQQLKLLLLLALNQTKHMLFSLGSPSSLWLCQSLTSRSWLEWKTGAAIKNHCCCWNRAKRNKCCSALGVQGHCGFAIASNHNYGWNRIQGPRCNWNHCCCWHRTKQNKCCLALGVQPHVTT